jgi:hypothetical protein
MCAFKFVSKMQPFSKVSCIRKWKTWSYNIEIHYCMPPFVDVGINLRFKGLNLKIMRICSKKTPTTLDVIIDHVILCVKKVLPSRVLFLEG